MDNSEQLPTVISFCSGYAGIERGLELAGIEHRVIAYVEIEAFAIANLVAKMEQGDLVPAPIWTDLKTFPAHLFRDSVDIITGGYPCQPFSVAGRAQAFNDPRHLFPYILDHVRTIRPSQCFFENVEGHINRGLESVLQDLEGAGYDSTWGIFSAEEVGAPHQRKRIFILGNAKHHGLASSEIRRGIEETSDNNEGWKSEASKSQGASEREVNGDLCGEEISASISKRKQSVANSSGAGRQQISRSTHENESEHEGRSKVQTDITSSHGEGDRKRSMANSDSSRQLQSQGSESEQWGWTRNSGQEGTMADPDSHDWRDRSRTLPRERWPWLEHRGSGERQLVGQPEEELADTKSIGVQGLRTSGEQEPHSHGQEELPMRKNQAGGQANWLSEPNVGRVVDGCPDRVDRIRLLGNGVVPQTAARAWEVLNGRV